METLISTGTIRSIKEVWWDIRPHPDFGTVELRICDGLPTLHEVGMVAALTQCLVDSFDREIDRGLPPAGPQALGGQGEQVAGRPLRHGRGHHP